MEEHATPKPLDGVRVMEFGQAIAAPTCGRYLSALGAEVIKVENLAAPDLIRAAAASWLPPEVNAQVRFDISPMGGEFVSGKLSAGLNITHPKGRPLLERLIEVSDVVLINYSASAIRDLRLRGEDVAAIKPDIIYAGLPAFGYDEDAPYFTYKAWGPNQAPISGIDHLTGWPDRPASGLSSFSYPDFTGGMQAALAVMAAVLHHDMTGEGQLIDISQLEVAMAAIGPVMLDYLANGEPAGATGNSVPWASPQGTYPAAGTERWVAISCWEDAHWQALCQVADGQEFPRADRFATAGSRIDNAAELDAAIADWTAGFYGRDLVYRLQQAGCPAGLVADQADLLVDPQLEARRAFSVADSVRLGKDFCVQFPVRMSGAPAGMPRGSPAVGQDNAHVFGELLGITADQRRELAGEGVVFDMAEPESTFEWPSLRWVRHLWRDDWPAPAAAGS